MRPHGVSELRAILDRPLAAPADGATGSGYSAIFPEPSGDGRGRQLEETWASLVAQLREPVDTTLRGGMSAGDIAYRLGELVHGYFRTRGVTLTSFELRRIVVALLDNYRHGWPALTDSTSDIAAAFAGAGSAEALVAFERDSSQQLPSGTGWNGEVPAARPASVALPDLPSPLVSVAPRSEEPLMPPSPPEQAPAATVAPSEPPKPVPPVVSPAAAPAIEPPPAVVFGNAALAAIMPALQQQRASAPRPPASRRDIMLWLRGAVAAALAGASITVAETERDALEHQAFDELFGLGPLEAAMRDETVAAIFINGPGSVFVDRRGRLEPARISFSDAAQLDKVIARLAERAGVPPGSDRDPLIDRRLDDGTRVIITAPPLASAGPYVVITRPVSRTVTLDSLVAENVLSPQMASVLRLAVRSRLNLLVCGAPGTGKTALLAALARVAAGENRVITIERAAELQLNVPHHVPLIVTGNSGAAPASALTAALALRPDRLLIDNVTESVVSGVADAVWRGVDGIVASFGATTPQEALERLEAQLRTDEPALPLVEARRRLARSFELVVHLGRQHDGVRRAQQLADVAVEGDAIACRDLFTFDPAAGRFVPTGLRPSFLPRVARAGLERALLDAL